MYPGWLILNSTTLVLAVLLLIFQKGNRHAFGSRAFIRLVGMTISLILVDSVGIFSTEILQVQSVSLRRFCSYYVFAFDPLAYLFMIYYIDQYVQTKKKNHREYFLIPMRVYVILNMLLVTVSALFHFGWFFRYPDGVYMRGPYFAPRAFINMLFGIMVQVYVIRYNRFINRIFRMPLTLFPAIVLFGGGLQLAFRGLSLEYTATILACLILFTYVQRVDLNGDALTGTMNRRGLDTSLEKLSAPGQNKPFGAVMIDLDFFKEINDTFGHNVGDEVLILVAETLNRSFPHKAVVGRHGGDEFIVYLPETTPEELETCVRLFRTNLDELNQGGKRPYQIQISMGYGVFEPGQGQDIKAFRETIDRKMYEEKAENHARAGYVRGGRATA